MTVQGDLFCSAPRATWSPCRRYRYTLEREFRLTLEPRIVTWIMLNPSTADEDHDDATISKCIARAVRWGFSRLVVVNAYAWRSTDPTLLRSDECRAAGGPVGEGNDAAILDACTRAALVVCGWGNNLAPDRRSELARLLRGVPLTALRINSNGSPSHPLYLPFCEPQPFVLEEK
jgi:hypothetical protein